MGTWLGNTAGLHHLYKSVRSDELWNVMENRAYTSRVRRGIQGLYPYIEIFVASVRN